MHTSDEYEDFDIGQMELAICDELEDNLMAGIQQRLHPSNLDDPENLNFVNQQRCAAHTIQMALKDASSDSEESNNVIEKIRKFMHIVRRKQYITLLERLNLKSPTEDVHT